MKEQKPVKSDEAMTDNFEYAIAYNRRILKLVGVWPVEKNDTSRKSEGTTMIIWRIINGCIIFLYMIPQYMYILSKPNLEEHLPLMSPRTFQLLGIIKFVTLILNGEKIRYCVTCMREDWANVRLKEDRETMMRNAKLARLMTICCCGCMYSGIVFYIIGMPRLVDLDDETTANRTNSIEKSLLPFPAIYMFCNERSTPIYQITWVIQFVGSSYMCFLNCGCYGLTGVFVAHACGQLRVIASQLEDLVDGHRKETRTVMERIATVVEHHLRVMRYVKYMNQLLQMTFLTDELGALAVICFSGYSVLMTWKYDKFTLRTTIFCLIMVAVIFNFFVISSAGQQLWNESEVLSLATSNVQWYRLPPELARSLIMCTIHSARPLKLSTYNMFDICLANFGDVLKGAMVFLNMVLTVTGVE